MYDRARVTETGRREQSVRIRHSHIIILYRVYKYKIQFFFPKFFISSSQRTFYERIGRRRGIASSRLARVVGKKRVLRRRRRCAASPSARSEIPRRTRTIKTEKPKPQKNVFHTTSMT